MSSGRRFGPPAGLASLLLLGGALALLGGALACAGPQLRVREAPQAQTLTPRVILVYPYAFRWPEPPWRAYQKSRDLVDGVLADGRHLVVGPSELRVRRPEQDNVAGGSDVMNVLGRLRIPAKEAVVLRGWAEERVATSAAVITDARGRRAGARQSRTRTLVAHLEAIHVWSGRILVEAEAKVDLDPFAAYPDWDPLAPLTAANRTLLKEVLERLQGDQRPAELGARLAVNPAAAFTFRAREGAEDGRAGLARLDALEQDVVRLSVYRYFDEDLSPGRVQLYRRAAHGALVSEVRGAPAQAAGLKPGDLAVEIGGVPVTGPETVLRQLALAKPGSEVPMVVLRGEARRTVVLAKP